MEKDKKNTAKMFINVALVAVLLVCAIIIYFIKGFSWFAQDRSAEAQSGPLSTVGVALGDCSIYEYGIENGTPTLTPSEDVGFSVGTDVEKIFVLELANDSTEPVLFTYTFNDLLVNYYALQKYGQTQLADLDAFTKQYRIAGPYINQNSETLDYMSPSLDSCEQYLSFVRPCTNALKISTATLPGLTASTAQTSITSAIFTDTGLTYDTEQVLLNSLDGVTSLQASATAEGVSPQKIWVLNDAVTADTYFPVTPADSLSEIASFAPVTVPANSITAVVMKLRFDTTVYTQSTVGADTVTMQNSNPFMYQRLKIDSVRCTTTKG